MKNRYLAIMMLFIANLLGLIYILPRLRTQLFFLEFLAIAFFMLLFMFTLYGFFFDVPNKYIMNSVFFIFGLINTIFLYFNIKTIMLVFMTAANAFGFVICINSIRPRKRKKKDYIHIEELKPEAGKSDDEKIISDIKKELEEYKRKKEIEEIEKEAKMLAKAEKKIQKIKKDVKKKYSPGKFVASKNANLYHAPKCEWANKIKPNNRTWFKTKSEAKKKGYYAHSCLKK